MNTIEIKGVTYQKASDLARELGYTNDYIGQLCRAGKVEAELVGRTWYVDPKSIAEHKSTRYRSTKSKTEAALRTSIANMHPSSQTTRHIHLHTYESDEAPLYPKLKEVKNKPHAEAQVHYQKEEKQTISVKTSEEPLDITIEQEESAVFSGTLEIRSHDEVDTSTVLETFQSAVVSSGAKKRVGISHLESTADRVVVKNNSTTQELSSVGYSISATIVTVLVTTLIFVVLLSLETTVVITENSAQQAVSFDFKKTATVIYSLMK